MSERAINTIVFAVFGFAVGCLAMMLITATVPAPAPAWQIVVTALVLLPSTIIGARAGRRIDGSR